VKSISKPENMTGDENVSVSDLDDGVYVVSARYSNGEVASERIVVQK